MNSSSNRELHRTKAFVRDLKKMPDEVKRQSWQAVQRLAENLFDPTLDIKKLAGYKNVWRVTIKQIYRLIYTFDERNIYLLRIAHRKDIYRKPFQDLD